MGKEKEIDTPWRELLAILDNISLDPHLDPAVNSFLKGLQVGLKLERYHTSNEKPPKAIISVIRVTKR